MTYQNTWRGFTLIELLVVILIIGILVAVAVPQYKKAVIKSELATIQPILREIKNNQEVYYLNTGQYASLIDTAALNIPTYCKDVLASGVHRCRKSFLVNFYHDSFIAVQALYCPNHTTAHSECIQNTIFEYYLFLDHSDKPGHIQCTGKTSLGKSICKGINGK